MLMQNKGSNLSTKVAILAIALAGVLYLKNCVKSGALTKDDASETTEAPQEPAADTSALPGETSMDPMAPTDAPTDQTTPSETEPAP